MPRERRILGKPGPAATTFAPRVANAHRDTCPRRPPPTMVSSGRPRDAADFPSTPRLSHRAALEHRARPRACRGCSCGFSPGSCC